METVEYTYGPKTLHLYMSASAMFDIESLNAENQPDILDRILPNAAEATMPLCQVAHILARSGELCRRHLGYSPERIPPAIELHDLLKPVQIAKLRVAVFQAINAGYSNETSPTSGDVDVGLLELEKKTKL